MGRLPKQMPLPFQQFPFHGPRAGPVCQNVPLCLPATHGAAGNRLGTTGTLFCVHPVWKCAQGRCSGSWRQNRVVWQCQQAEDGGTPCRAERVETRGRERQYSRTAFIMAELWFRTTAREEQWASSQAGKEKDSRYTGCPCGPSSVADNAYWRMAAMPGSSLPSKYSSIDRKSVV